MLSFLYGTTWWAAYIIEDISNDLTELNETPNEMRAKMKERFGSIIRSYSDAKQLSGYAKTL